MSKNNYEKHSSSNTKCKFNNDTYVLLKRIADNIIKEPPSDNTNKYLRLKSTINK